MRDPRSSVLQRAVVVLAVATVLSGGCAASVPSTSPATPDSPPSSTSPPPTPASPSATPVDASATFPPPQTPIEPGAYRWDGFDPPIAVTVGAGWELGHDNPAFFDLFRGSDFPAVTFAQFTDVFADDTTRSRATDAAAVAATLGGRSDIEMTEPVQIELGGLSGLEFDLRTTAPKTPVFFGPAGDFRLEPDFSTRYRVLDVPAGGVLVIGIHDHGDTLDAAVALGDPLVTSLHVEPSNP